MNLTRIGRCAAALVFLVDLGAIVAEPPFAPDWATDAIWDDGLAEVATYDASREIYGAARSYQAIVLTVKEDFDADSLVKADPPFARRAIVPVLKQNVVREITTPNYDYRIMTSTFVERQAPERLVKLTSGSQEWCGNTWKAIRQRKGRLTYNWSSYFDGEADGVQELVTRPDGDLALDQLPLTLRGLRFRVGLELGVRLIPSMATSHAGPIRWQEASVAVTAREELSTPAGVLRTWRVEVIADDRRWTYWFDTEGTHPLVRMESDGGDTLMLKAIERRAYWKLP